MKKLMVLVIAALALFAFSGRLAYAHDTEITLTEQNGSGQNGTAVFTDLGDGTTRVVIQISNGSETPQPAHIHAGTCANLDPKPTYPLTSVVNGMSETVVEVDVHDLTEGEFAVNVHKSAAEASVYTSCGDIVASEHGEEPGMPRTGGADFGFGLTALVAVAMSLVGVGLRFSRRAA